MTRNLIAGIFLLFLAITQCRAGQVQLALHEGSAASTKIYSIDTDTLALSPVPSVSGTELARTTRYTLVDRKLVIGNVKLADASEILFQCEVDGIDLVVMRVEYNSFGGPIRLLAALAGHPIQVSKIMVLAISEGKIRSQKVITRKDSSYAWSASVFH